METPAAPPARPTAATPAPLLVRSSPPAPMPPPASVSVLGVRFDVGSVADAAARIVAWAEAGEARYACFSGAHGVVEAQDDPAFRAALNGADLNVPDGMSVVRATRRLGALQPERVYCPAATEAVVRLAAARGVPVALYGSSDEVLARLRERLPQLAPGLQIADAISPPFRPLTADEDAAFCARLRASGARIVLVGLGCPRQERWCAAHAASVGAVCLAVGAAFDFHAGTLAQAPRWVQRAGLEWAFRLAMEPRRLWPRYARVVPRFLVGFARQRRAQRRAARGRGSDSDPAVGPR